MYNWLAVYLVQHDNAVSHTTFTTSSQQVYPGGST